MGYCTVESLLDEAAFNLRRYSRSSGGQRTERTGGSMRIVKPNSTSSSPRESIALGRRRTVMYDRRRMVADHNSGSYISNESLQHPAKANRPVSWHPSSHSQPQPQPQQVYQYTESATNFNRRNEFQHSDFPPTPTVYSGYASPSSTFSPVAIPFTGYPQQQYQYPEASDYTSTCNYAAYQQPASTQQAPLYLSAPTEITDSQMYTQSDWHNYTANGFDRSAGPPTPENFLPIQHPSPSFPEEEAIPYHPLSEAEEEEEGEILCGLGLYDSPDVLKSVPSDPQLDNYRSSVMSQLLEPLYGKEPVGKGLKLEETWNPPTSDDEEDEDEEADGDGDFDEEATFDDIRKLEDAGMPTVHQMNDVHGFPQRTQSFENLTWL